MWLLGMKVKFCIAVMLLYYVWPWHQHVVQCVIQREERSDMPNVVPVRIVSRNATPYRSTSRRIARKRKAWLERHPQILGPVPVLKKPSINAALSSEKTCSDSKALRKPFTSNLSLKFSLSHVSFCHALYVCQNLWHFFILVVSQNFPFSWPGHFKLDSWTAPVNWLSLSFFCLSTYYLICYLRFKRSQGIFMLVNLGALLPLTLAYTYLNFFKALTRQDEVDARVSALVGGIPKIVPDTTVRSIITEETANRIALCSTTPCKPVIDACDANVPSFSCPSDQLPPVVLRVISPVTPSSDSTKTEPSELSIILQDLGLKESTDRQVACPTAGRVYEEVKGGIEAVPLQLTSEAKAKLMVEPLESPNLGHFIDINTATGVTVANNVPIEEPRIMLSSIELPQKVSLREAFDMAKLRRIAAQVVFMQFLDTEDGHQCLNDMSFLFHFLESAASDTLPFFHDVGLQPDCDNVHVLKNLMLLLAKGRLIIAIRCIEINNGGGGGGNDEANALLEEYKQLCLKYEAVVPSWDQLLLRDLHLFPLNPTYHQTDIAKIMMELLNACEEDNFRAEEILRLIKNLMIFMDLEHEMLRITQFDRYFETFLVTSLMNKIILQLQQPNYDDPLDDDLSQLLDYIKLILTNEIYRNFVTRIAESIQNHDGI